MCMCFAVAVGASSECAAPQGEVVPGSRIPRAHDSSQDRCGVAHGCNGMGSLQLPGTLPQVYLFKLRSRCVSRLKILFQHSSEIRITGQWLYDIFICSCSSQTLSCPRTYQHSSLCIFSWILKCTSLTNSLRAASWPSYAISDLASVREQSSNPILTLVLARARLRWWFTAWQQTCQNLRSCSAGAAVMVALSSLTTSARRTGGCGTTPPRMRASWPGGTTATRSQV